MSASFFHLREDNKSLLHHSAKSVMQFVAGSLLFSYSVHEAWEKKQIRKKVIVVAVKPSKTTFTQVRFLVSLNYTNKCSSNLKTLSLIGSVFLLWWIFKESQTKLKKLKPLELFEEFVLNFKPFFLKRKLLFFKFNNFYFYFNCFELQSVNGSET